ncbi:hypothetical protein FRA_33c05460 [Francisella sp. W12-1067]|nr:hypothetical protein FRA_33c05460 [Francisella sp. W12-1067]
MKAEIRQIIIRQKYLKKRSLHVVNEHFENIFNTISAV